MDLNSGIRLAGIAFMIIGFYTDAGGVIFGMGVGLGVAALILKWETPPNNAPNKYLQSTARAADVDHSE